MADVPVRELPSSERVLSSLKSSGTFDRFRKSCMESIELEVSCIGRSHYSFVLSERDVTTHTVYKCSLLGRVSQQYNSRWRGLISFIVLNP